MPAAAAATGPAVSLGRALNPPGIRPESARPCGADAHRAPVGGVGPRSIHPPRSSRPRTPVMVAGWVRVRRAAGGRAGPHGRRPQETSDERGMIMVRTIEYRSFGGPEVYLLCHS